MSDQDSEPGGGEDEAHEESKKLVLEAIATLPPEVRSEIIDDLLERYCSMCAEFLDEEGECPEGCDPEDMLDEEDDDGGEDDGEEDSEEEDGGGTEGSEI